MFRASVMYPNDPGKKFDIDYYLNSHIPMIHRKLDNLGLAKIEVDKGTNTSAGNPSPFRVITHLYYNTFEDLQKIPTDDEEFYTDIPNYTDIQPIIQISEITQQ